VVRFVVGVAMTIMTVTALLTLMAVLAWLLDTV
jgi:hypothetical protein